LQTIAASKRAVPPFGTLGEIQLRKHCRLAPGSRATQGSAPYRTSRCAKKEYGLRTTFPRWPASHSRKVLL